MRQAYLTIDDSPSPRTSDLVDFLSARGVPAILFCRGDYLEQDPAPIVRAIQKGFVIGNHGYAHTRAAMLGYDGACANILRADALIDRAYAQAGVARPGKYYRFAYMDRGMGPWFVEPVSVPAAERPQVESMIREGLGNDPSLMPSAQDIALKDRLQAFLRAQSYVQTPFADIAHEFYTKSEMARAVDAMFTYSTSDWAVTERHRGKFGFSGVEDLKSAIDRDRSLQRDDSTHIILMHDQAEIHETACALVDHFLDRGFTFRELS